MARSTEQSKLIDKFIGKKLLEFRIAKGFTRDFVAQSIGVTHQQLFKYEMSSNRISASKLLLIANFLKVDIKEFFQVDDQIQSCEADIEDRKLLLTISKSLSSIKDNNFKHSVNQLVKAFVKSEAK